MTTVMAGELAGAQTPDGGMTVAQHLAHTAGVTTEWLSQLDEGAAEPLPILYDDTREVWASALATAINAEGKGHLSHPSPAQLVTHMLIHDEHHRGPLRGE